MRLKIQTISAACVLSCLLAMQACGFKDSSELACNFVQNSQGQRVSWGAKTPVQMSLHQSVPATYRAAIEAAAQRWNDVVGRRVIQINAGVVGGNPGPNKDNQNVIYVLDQWEQDQVESEQARTSIYWIGPHIVEADMALNSVGFEFSVTPEVEAGKVDLESLALHELGHVLGLNHVDTEGSVMVEQLAKGPSLKAVRRQIKPSIDYDDALSCEY